MSAQKHDSEKVRMELLPPDVLRLTAQVFTKGAEKYAPWNWCKGFEWSRLYGALQRHLNAWWEGEDNDPEWGLPHLGHAMCCLMMLAAHELRRLGKDDRQKITRRVVGLDLGRHDSLAAVMCRRDNGILIIDDIIVNKPQPPEQIKQVKEWFDKTMANRTAEVVHDDGYRICLRTRFPHLWKTGDASLPCDLGKETLVKIASCEAHEVKPKLTS